MVAARRTIDQLRAIPQDAWNVIPLIAGIYVLFPNTVFILQGDHVETWHVYPSGDGVNEATMRVSFYTPEPPMTEKARLHWDRNFKLLMDTVELEDFPLAEGIQRGFHSPAQEAIHFGRNEPALAALPQIRETGARHELTGRVSRACRRSRHSSRLVRLRP